MKHHFLMAATAAATLFLVEPALAVGPPAGVRMGPPASVTMGPPASVTMGPPASVTMGPPASVTMGPPASVTMGPPSSVTRGPSATALAHIPNGVPLGKPDVPQGTAASSGDTIGSTVSASATTNVQDPSGPASDNSSVADAADILGNLNAAHASSTALAHASSNSIVGEIAAYKTAMDTAYQDYNSGTIDYTTYQGDVSTAQTNLSTASNKQLTSDAIAKIDNLLGVTVAPAPSN